MRRLKIVGLCLVAVFAAIATAAASASAAVPTWYECAKASKVDKSYVGHYTGKDCEEATKVETGGKYELKEGVGKGKAFKGKNAPMTIAVLHVKTWLGDDTVECIGSKDSGTPVLPDLEKEVSVTYSKCVALGNKKCTSAGAKTGEVKVTGLKGELGYVEESPVVVGLKLESEAHPGPSGELAKFTCEDLEATLIGGVIGVQEKDVNVINKESEVVDVASARIGEHEFEGFKYTPLVNIVGWADEQTAIAKELEEDLKGEIVKLMRPIVKTAICGEFIEDLLHVHCAPEAYAGLDSTTINKGEALEIKT